MGKQLLAAVIALTAAPGLAPGADGASRAPAPRLTPLRAGQATSPPFPAGAESAPRPGFVPGSTPGPDPGESWAVAERAGDPASRFWVRGEYLLWWIRD